MSQEIYKDLSIVQIFVLSSVIGLVSDKQILSEYRQNRFAPKLSDQSIRGARLKLLRKGYLILEGYRYQPGSRRVQVFSRA